MTKLAPLALLLLSVSMSAGCGFPKTGAVPAALSARQRNAAAGRWPGTTAQSLITGHDVFVSKCNGCHGYPDIDSIGVDRWPDVMHKMASKADLTETQERDVLHFILAQREYARAEPAPATSAQRANAP